MNDQLLFDLADTLQVELLREGNTLRVMRISLQTIIFHIP